MHCFICAVVLAGSLSVSGAAAVAQAPVPSAADAPVVPSGYVIGPDDVLSIIFWRDKDMSVDAVVRPDGRISLPLLNDITAAGMTPEALRVKIDKAAAKFLEDPSVTIVVKAINSRKVFITGNVAKPGNYPLTSGLNVLQLIAMAGGLLEYADKKNIVVIRKGDPADQYFKFNYNDVVRQKKIEQNIELKSGDTVVVS